MKEVQLKVVEVETGGKIDYREQMLRILQAPENPHGTDYAEMAVALPLIRKFDEALSGCPILLEDAEHAYCVRRLKAAKYGGNHQEIFDMIEEFCNAQEP